ncbi:GatB/YqeY domain-containing protein [Lacrimispora sp.]|uniref:GatB/YqeY domain-containing protein n=1 Tax=Lacrimispora sp. TaxID=2719234 RepID=UPI00345F723A
MSRIDEVRAAMVEAMKSKDKKRKDSLSMLLAALKNFEIDKKDHTPITEEEADAVVKKELKQSQETYDTAPADRDDIREEAGFRISVYKEFAPEDMSEDQIKEVILSVLKELEIETPSPADKGKIMKALMPKVKGKADGKVVNELLAAMMKS